MAINYYKISYIEKNERLQSVFEYASRLSESINVFRRTLLNWRDKPDSVSAENRRNIDVLYCRHFLIPQWDDPKQRYEPFFITG